MQTRTPHSAEVKRMAAESQARSDRRRAEKKHFREVMTAWILILLACCTTLYFLVRGIIRVL